MPPRPAEPSGDSHRPPAVESAGGGGKTPLRRESPADPCRQETGQETGLQPVPRAPRRADRKTVNNTVKQRLAADAHNQSFGKTTNRFVTKNSVHVRHRHLTSKPESNRETILRHADGGYCLA